MTPNRPIRRLAALLLMLCVALAACTSDEAVEAADTSTETTEATATTEAAMADDEPTVTVRESGITVTVQALENVTVHSLTAPEAVFANSTHIIETDASLVLVDAQFLLPNAADVRAYADSLGKPVAQMFITHAHPDHFLGGEAFADLPMASLADVVADIEANGQAEVDEKQADFGEAIAGSFVVPEVVEPGTVTVDGVDMELIEVLDAEAHTQLVIRIPSDGVVVTGDLIYSGVHLILAGPPDTWSEALVGLQANGDTLILPGHGVPAGPEVIDANLDYLATAGGLLGSVDNADDFRNGLLEAYPALGMEAAIDFAIPAFFPEAAAPAGPEVSVRESGMTVTVQAFETVTVHSLTAPEAVFANSTHIFETADSLVLVDAQFLLPNAADVRAYAESLGKPMDRLFISHAHPDHFLGAEAFADVPQYALADVVADIEANGQAEVDEKQADFGEAIAGSFVVPEVVEPGELVLGGTTFELSEVLDAEAHTQLVIRVPADGVVATGDLIYSGVHLILAGPADTWTAALEGLQANGDTVILPGHGLPAGAEVIDANIAYLATTMELLGSVDNADDFRDGLLAAYPDLTMEAAIDFATPVLFPNG